MSKADKKYQRFTKPFMPPISEVMPFLEKIAKTGILTNGGDIQAELENALCNYLAAEHISLFTNGTTALMLAIKALDIKGEIITTPFTSVATAQAMYWNNCKPVFVDINENDLNIDVEKIEKAITPDTKAIIPVHIFGNPCDVEVIDEIAKKHNLKVIYDAAHSFGVKHNNVPLCNFGDLSVLSFHATKTFNTIEGGAVICHDKETKQYMDALKNTGLTNEYELASYGFNAKMNELQAAFGLANLAHIDRLITGRKKATMRYREILKNVMGISTPETKALTDYNYTYFPIIVNNYEFGKTRDELMHYLNNKKIVVKKYFHPLVTDYPQFRIFNKGNMPVAKKIADSVLCLPLYHDITDDEISIVVDEIIKFQNL